MTRVRAYKINENLGQTASEADIRQNFDLHMIGGLVEDFNDVVGALKTFPYKSALSLVGFIALVFIAFKAGRRFGIMQSRIKGNKR